MAAAPLEPTAGRLIVAPPMLLDPNFRRTVVLLCEHGEEGSFGLILNRPLTLCLGEVLDGFLGDAGRLPLTLGGPVQPNTLHFVHAYGDAFGPAISLTPTLSWGGDFDQLTKHLHDPDADRSQLRLFLGYAGWSPGQLEAELADDDWLITPVRPTDVFTGHPETLWRDVLRRMGGEYALLANFPDDPRMN